VLFDEQLLIIKCDVTGKIEDSSIIGVFTSCWLMLYIQRRAGDVK